MISKTLMAASIFMGISFHIPDKGQVIIRYYGLYSDAHRGKIRKTASAHSSSPIREDDQTSVLSNG